MTTPLKRERTVAITVGPWGGVWFTGKRRLVWRLCLGFVAITYVPAEMTQMIDAWLNAQSPSNVLTGEGAHQAAIVATVRDDLERYTRGRRLHPVETLHTIAQHVGYYLARRTDV